MKSFFKYWFPVLLWMAVIFVVSTDLGSAENTGDILEPLLRWFVPSISKDAIEWAHFIVRKCGHLSEYAILALLVWRALSNPAQEKPTAWSWNRAGLALLIAAIYAASDEFHQSFIPTRTPAVKDVMIDSCGALAGLLLLFAWRMIFRRKATSVP